MNTDSIINSNTNNNNQQSNYSNNNIYNNQQPQQKQQLSSSLPILLSLLSQRSLSASSISFYNTFYRTKRNQYYQSTKQQQHNTNHAASTTTTLQQLQQHNRPIVRYSPDRTNRIIISQPSSLTSSSSQRQQQQQQPIPKTLNLCNQYRYLLTGDQYGCISILDLSRLGRSKRHTLPNRQHNTTTTTTNDYCHYYEPIQQAFIPTTDSTTGTIVPDRTSTNTTKNRNIICTQWYPIDNGAFVTGTTGGNINFWDTNTMTPVLTMEPYRYDQRSGKSTTQGGDDDEAPSLQCAIMNPHPSSGLTTLGLIVCCSLQSRIIKMVDIKSGSSSHTFQTNGVPIGCRGYTTVSWSPTNPYMFVSGSTRNIQDPTNGGSCIVIWDIRKVGSLSCRTILDQNYNQNTSRDSPAYDPNHGNHWYQMKQEQYDRQYQQQQQLLAIHQKQQRAIISKQLKRETIPLSNSKQRGSRTTIHQRLQNTNRSTSGTLQSSSKKRKQEQQYDIATSTDRRTTSSSSLVSPNNYNPTVRNSGSSYSYYYAHSSSGASNLRQVIFDSAGQYIISSTNNYNSDTEYIKVWDLRTAGHWMKSYRYTIPSNSTGNNGGGGGGGPMIMIDHFTMPSASSLFSNNTTTTTSKPYNDCTMIWNCIGNQIYGYCMGYNDEDGSGSSGGEPIIVLQGHVGTNIEALIHDPIQDRIISSSNDGLILLWSLQQHQHQRQQQQSSSLLQNSRNTADNDDTAASTRQRSTLRPYLLFDRDSMIERQNQQQQQRRRRQRTTTTDVDNW